MTDESKAKEPSDDELTITAIQANLATLRADMELLELHMQKLDEVYYHVFPDRLPKDVKFGNQLLDVMRSAKSDPDKKQ